MRCSVQCGRGEGKRGVRGVKCDVERRRVMLGATSTGGGVVLGLASTRGGFVLQRVGRVTGFGYRVWKGVV